MSKNIAKQTIVKGSTGKSYKVSQLKDGKFSCSCERWINTTPRKDCKHIISLKTGKPVPKATKKVRSNGSLLSRKTTRAAVISLLLQHKNKTVAMPVVIATVKKTKGFDTKTATAKINSRRKQFSAFAKSHGFQFVASSNGLKFQTVGGGN